MSEPSPRSKTTLRQEMLDWRNQLPREDWERRSEAICRRLLDDFVTRGQVVMGFAAKDREVSLVNLFEDAPDDVTFCLPSTDPENNLLEVYSVEVPEDFRRSLENESPAESFVRGAHEILEPSPEINRSVQRDSLDMVIVPGLVFDERGNRIGYGEGYYDKFLSGLDDATGTVGVCFDEQLVSDPLPVAEHDVPVERVVTDRRMK